MKQQPQLNFELLDQRVDDLVKSTETNHAGAVERWTFVIALLGAGLGALIGTLVGGKAGLLIVQIGLAIEIVGFGLYGALALRRQWASVRRSRRAHAGELDADYVEFRRVVDWLHHFPEHEVSRRLRYIRASKTAMSYRLGLFTGGIERLGVLPLLAVLYLQFKDWKYGDWDALGKVNMVGGLLLWALLMAYVAGWWLIRLRIRLETYEYLLAEAENSTAVGAR